MSKKLYVFNQIVGERNVWSKIWFITLEGSCCFEKKKLNLQIKKNVALYVKTSKMYFCRFPLGVKVSLQSAITEPAASEGC